MVSEIGMKGQLHLYEFGIGECYRCLVGERDFHGLDEKEPVVKHDLAPEFELRDVGGRKYHIGLYGVFLLYLPLRKCLVEFGIEPVGASDGDGITCVRHLGASVDVGLGACEIVSLIEEVVFDQ